MPKIKKAQDSGVSFRVLPSISKKDKRQSKELAGDSAPLVTPADIVRKDVLTEQQQTTSWVRQQKAEGRKGEESTLIKDVPVTNRYVLEKYCTAATSAAAPATDAGLTSGTGHIIFYPDGRVEGRASNGSEEGLSFTGTEIASARECTRDTDWQLLKLSITWASGGVSTVLAEKQGGDAAKLRMLEPHGVEADELQDLLAACSGSGRFEFDCEFLMDGAGADAALRSIGEEHACGKDAVLNTGCFRWESSTRSQGGVQNLSTLYDSDLDG